MSADKCPAFTVDATHPLAPKIAETFAELHRVRFGDGEVVKEFKSLADEMRKWQEKNGVLHIPKQPTVKDFDEAIKAKGKGK